VPCHRIAGIAVGFLTSFYFYLKAREKVDPRYLLSFEPLVSPSSGAMKDVSVRYNDICFLFGTVDGKL